MAGAEIAKRTALVTTGVAGYGLGTEALMNQTAWQDGKKALVQGGAGLLTGAILAYFQPSLGIGVMAGGVVGGLVHGARWFNTSSLMRQVTPPTLPEQAAAPQTPPQSLPQGQGTAPTTGGRIYDMSAGRFR